MNDNAILSLRKMFGTEELSEKDVKYRVVRSCVGIATAVCIVYGAYSIPQNALIEAQKAAKEAPRLVILGREEEETVALIAESIQQEDGTVLSLDDFLGMLICGACSRKCPLLAPRCRRGMSKAETQTAYYEEAIALIENADPLLNALSFDDV